MTWREYAACVLAGRVPFGDFEASPGELLRLAVQRDAADRERWSATSREEAQGRGDEFYFDEISAERAVRWPALYCRQTDGEFAGELLTLRPWQAWIEAVTEGWRSTVSGLRRFRHRYIKVGSGNGKTTWSASHGTRMLAGDREPGAEVYTVGTHRGQALLLWNAARDMVNQSPELQRFITVYDSPNNHRLAALGQRSFMSPLSRDTEAVSQEGLKPHAVYFDEVHEYRGFSQRKLYDILLKKGLKRRQTLYTYITTAGDGSPDALITEIDAYSEDVLRGWKDDSFRDEHWFAAIYQVDDEDDPFDAALTDGAMLAMVSKANPNLGVSVHTDILVEQWRAARKVAAKRAPFLRYSCNRDASTVALAINPEDWAACAVGREDWDAHCLGRDTTLGIDLSSSVDLTAICEQALDEGGIRHYRWHVFMPEGQLRKREKEDNVPYSQWVRDGWLNLIPGDKIDYAVIATKVGEILGRQIVEMPGGIGFDPWHSTELLNRLKEYGIDAATAIPQFMSQMTEATKLFLDELELRAMRHDGNPLVAWCAKNACTREDSNGNKVFHKRLSRHRIDPVVASAMARQRGMWLDLGGSMYSDDEPEEGTAVGDDGEPVDVPGGGVVGSMYDEIPAEYL